MSSTCDNQRVSACLRNRMVVGLPTGDNRSVGGTTPPKRSYVKLRTD
ncbi:hypothetical protein [Bremerella alba]|nr:hypothetical protein [Bremerella alba]